MNAPTKNNFAFENPSPTANQSPNHILGSKTSTTPAYITKFYSDENEKVVAAQITSQSQKKSLVGFVSE